MAKVDDRARPKWTPGKRSLAFDWYLTRIMRYGIGGAGLAWEIVVDKAKNPLVLLIVAQLATSTDVLSFVRGLIKQAHAERRTLDQIISEEEKRVEAQDE